MNTATDSADGPRPTDRPAGCDAFATTINAVLDREVDAAALVCEHVSVCSECRELAQAARQFLGVKFPHPAPPPDLAERVVATAIRHRKMRSRRRIAGSALAASAVVAVASYLTWPTPDGPQTAMAVVHTIPAKSPATVTPERVSDRVAEAGSAFVAITRRARDRTIEPTRSLIPPPDAVTVPTGGPLTVMEPAAESLATLPGAARSGFVPVADKTRRAVNLFMRDVGLSESVAPKY